jgi:hypothetical protein
MAPQALGLLLVKDSGEGEGGMRRQFIPARLEDNPSMAADDPRYAARLEGLGARALVQAMRWGDWDVVAIHIRPVRWSTQGFETIPKDDLNTAVLDLQWSN